MLRQGYHALSKLTQPIKTARAGKKERRDHDPADTERRHLLHTGGGISHLHTEHRVDLNAVGITTGLFGRSVETAKQLGQTFEVTFAGKIPVSDANGSAL